MQFLMLVYTDDALLEADSLDEAMRIAQEFPWARTGSIEVRPVRDMGAVRRRVGG